MFNIIFLAPCTSALQAHYNTCSLVISVVFFIVVSSLIIWFIIIFAIYDLFFQSLSFSLYFIHLLLFWGNP